MRFPQSVVCFLDILGFARMVDDDARSLEPVHLPRIVALMSSIQPSLAEKALSARQFSDSIVLAAPYSVDNALLIIEQLRFVQTTAVTQEILLRGGLSIGPHYAEEPVYYSKGLINAYRIESKLAKMPRIIVDRDLLDLLVGTAAPTGTTHQRLRDAILRDRDGHAFLDYLRPSDIREHEGALRRMLRKADLNDPSILEKYFWLTNYHNFTCQRSGLGQVDFGMPELSQLPVNFAGA